MYFALRTIRRFDQASVFRHIPWHPFVNRPPTGQYQERGLSCWPTLHYCKIVAKPARMGATDSPGDTAIDNGTRGMEDYLRVALLAAKEAGLGLIASKKSLNLNAPVSYGVHRREATTKTCIEALISCTGDEIKDAFHKEKQVQHKGGLLPTSIDFQESQGQESLRYSVAKHDSHMLYQTSDWRINAQGVVDLVTETDKKCEEIVFSSIREAFPDHKFIGEEDSAAQVCKSPVLICHV
jgi:hypothetical protein